jgi:hypothetical protein
MAYGVLDSRQKKALRALIKGKKVHDLGCGDQSLSDALVSMGAKQVIAVDSHPFGQPVLAVTTVKSSFSDYAATSPEPEIDIAFVSWPVNRSEPGLLSLVMRAKIVAYLGKCTDGTCCGWPMLFQHFLGRELLTYVPESLNTLCIYGSEIKVPRTGELEERAGLDWQKMMPGEAGILRASLSE